MRRLSRAYLRSPRRARIRRLPRAPSTKETPDETRPSPRSPRPSSALSPALAADAESCKAIRLSDPGWTDITSTNAIASTLLTALGYAPEVKTLSVPIGYQAMKDGDIDVFLGNWMPAQQHFRDDLDAAKAAEVIAQNLAGAKFTLAVPTAAATELGVADFKDLAAHADAFDEKIYGIETGAPAQPEPAEDDRRRRLRPRRLGAGRDPASRRCSPR